jgi:hypothetical protein
MGAVLAAPRGAGAQQPRRARLGYLSNSADVTALDAVFLGRLRELGYGDDQIVIRFSAGDDSRLPQLAAELVRSGVDGLATWGPAATSALQKDELTRAFDEIKASRVDALVVLGDPGVFWTYRKVIADTLAALRLPVMHTVPETVIAGGLMSYGPNYAETARRGAAHVDKIVRGARPEDLRLSSRCGSSWC